MWNQPRAPASSKRVSASARSARTSPPYERDWSRKRSFPCSGSKEAVRHRRPPSVKRPQDMYSSSGSTSSVSDTTPSGPVSTIRVTGPSSCRFPSSSSHTVIRETRQVRTPVSGSYLGVTCVFREQSSGSSKVWGRNTWVRTPALTAEEASCPSGKGFCPSPSVLRHPDRSDKGSRTQRSRAESLRILLGRVLSFGKRIAGLLFFLKM